MISLNKTIFFNNQGVQITLSARWLEENPPMSIIRRLCEVTPESALTEEFLEFVDMFNIQEYPKCSPKKLRLIPSKLLQAGGDPVSPLWLQNETLLPNLRHLSLLNQGELVPVRIVKTDTEYKNCKIYTIKTDNQADKTVWVFHGEEYQKLGNTQASGISAKSFPRKGNIKEHTCFYPSDERDINDPFLSISYLSELF